MGGDRLPSPVRPVIDQSWARLAGAGLHPDRVRPREVFGESELADARRLSPVAAVMPVLRRFLGSVAVDAQHVMVVCDESGHILWMEGDPRVKRFAERIPFAEGLLWTESSAGTNAIGTALAIDHAVQVFSAEHFMAAQHAWWCSAAPIHDTATGELLGIVDLSGPLRTAHPHSFALVQAAAAAAEDALRLRLVEEDDQLRALYLERVARGHGEPSALVARGGRVLLAYPPGWPPRRVQLPGEDGLVALGDGCLAVAEPLGDGRGWFLRPLARDVRGARPPGLRLALLGPARRLQVGSGPALGISLRHAEILVLLALYPKGLTAEQLALHLRGEAGNRVSVRVEMSRLRKLLSGCLAAQPYRLIGEVQADFLEVERLLAAGRLVEAMEAYGGSLLPDSDAVRVRQARDELDGAIQRAAVAGPLSCLWQWLQRESGRDDRVALAEFVRKAASDDPRRPLAAARLRSLQLGE